VGAGEEAEEGGVLLKVLGKALLVWVLLFWGFSSLLWGQGGNKTLLQGGIDKRSPIVVTANVMEAQIKKAGLSLKVTLKRLEGTCIFMPTG